MSKILKYIPYKTMCIVGFNIATLCTAFSINVGTNQTEINQKRTHLLKNFKPQKPIIHRLPNGLTVIIDVDKRAPVVSHTVWYRVGSADENKGESGMAHFLEHLLFKGTKKYQAGYFSKRVSEIGGEDNAFTTNDFTAYYQNVPREYLPEMMMLEADRMQNIHISDKDFINEKKVILEERSLRIDNQPTAQLIEQMSSILYRNHPYGSPVIGWKHEIENLTLPNVYAFYRKHYNPSNAVVTVIGDVNPQEIINMTIKHYGSLKTVPSAHTTKGIRLDEPPQNVVRSVHMPHKNVTTPSLFMMNEAISPAKDVKDFYALSLGLKALAGDSHSLLYKKLVKENKIALSVGVFAATDRKDNSAVIFQLVPAKGVSLAKLKQVFLAELLKIIDKGISENDISREKNMMISEYLSAFDSRGNRARFWGISYMLNQDINQTMSAAQTIHSVTTTDVKKVLKKIYTPTNQVWGFLEPTHGVKNAL